MGMFLNQTEMDGYVDEWCKKCVHYSSNGAIADCAVLAAHKACQTEDVNRTPSVLAFFIKRKGGTNDKCTMFRSNAGEDISAEEAEAGKAAPIHISEFADVPAGMPLPSVPDVGQVAFSTGMGPSFESPAVDMGDGKIGYPLPPEEEPNEQDAVERAAEAEVADMIPPAAPASPHDRPRHTANPGYFPALP